jgi:hypothetical protein
MPDRRRYQPSRPPSAFAVHHDERCRAVASLPPEPQRFRG